MEKVFLYGYFFLFIAVIWGNIREDRKLKKQAQCRAKEKLQKIQNDDFFVSEVNKKIDEARKNKQDVEENLNVAVPYNDEKNFNSFSSGNDDFVSEVDEKIEEASENKQKESPPSQNVDDFAQEALSVVQQKAENNVSPSDEKNLYTIIYCDADGNPTKRDIIYRGFYVGDNEKLYVSAFCLLRNSVRTFALERIAKLWQDGKEIENPSEYFLNLYKNSDEYKAGVFIDEHIEEIACFVFVARADGTMQKNEREAIIEYCASFDNAFDAKILEYPIKDLSVDVKSFNLLLKKCKDWDEETKNKARECVKKIVSARKNPDPIEVAAGDKMLKALK